MIFSTIIYFLIFPGLLFASIAGGFLSWFDRKVTAMVQFRKGPPVLQPFYDFLKLLLVKETILPAKGSPVVFMLMPILALVGATLACVFILLPALNITSGFNGDILVIFYLLNIPALAFILGALASGNPLASIGASRELKLIISYELTFLLILAAVIFKAGMRINLQEIIMAQADTSFIGSISGILLFIAAIFCLQAKLGYVPFDIAEAETEINHGSFIEYSGSAYALVILTKYILLFTLPVFIGTLLLGGLSFTGINIVYSLLKILAIVLLLILIRNTNPRLKIHQAMRFFFVWMNLLVIIAITLSIFGR
ncbi:NADH-quinone oxidoreductase subunit H [Marinilabiliaceae bacterium JC017]|nr:NADH-quinone oxidoreductase subunit H [Marinilabiliaceae bacterium JC017]